MKKCFLYLILCCTSFPIYAENGNEPMNILINHFLSTDWPTVLIAKENIENRGAEGIPEMLKIMNDCKVHKLQNTGDLIYPGAEKFFGHGQIIDYDIDNICIRAGWLLEELSFKNFGFSGIHLPQNELSDFIKNNFPVYYGIAENQKQIEASSEDGKRALICALSIENARTWWEVSSKQWSRLTSLEQGLNSKDEKSQVKALFYLRNGKTACKGLNQKFYKSKLSKVIEKLSNSSTNRVSENAKLIMLDSDYSWLFIKPVH